VSVRPLLALICACALATLLVVPLAVTAVTPSAGQPSATKAKGGEAARTAPTRAKQGATSSQPALLGTAPPEGAKLVGNAVVFLFGDLPAELGTPSAEAANETTKKPVATRTALNCRGEGRGRRCVVNVTLLEVSVDHRYRIAVLGHVLNVTAAPGHPGDRR
jgi:hypothetical protein